MSLLVQDVSFSYRSYTTREKTYDPAVLSGVSFHLKAGEHAVLLSPPERGKTTLCRILSGLVPAFQDGTLKGSITLQGRDLVPVPAYSLTQACGYVSQNSQEQIITTTCEDEIAFPLESLGIPRAKIEEKVTTALYNWCLSTYRQVNPQELSGGERKRLLLAVLTAVNPPLWILDEPFEDLDGTWKRYLAELIAQTEASVLLCASRMEDAYASSFERFFFLDNGTLVEDTWTQVSKLYEQRYGRVELSPYQATRAKVLSAKDLEVARYRSSLDSADPFLLRVPEFSLASGEVVALTGPNGSGKSSLSRVLCGLDKKASGSVYIQDLPADEVVLQKTVAYLFQSPDYQIFLPTVRDELSWSLRRIKGMDKKQIDEQVDACANRFGLDPDETPATMAYGKRKLLQAAVSYMLKRPFIILDEADSGITKKDAVYIIQTFLELSCGIVIITHDDDFAATVADRGYHIVDGRVEPYPGAGEL